MGYGGTVRFRGSGKRRYICPGFRFEVFGVLCSNECSVLSCADPHGYLARSIDSCPGSTCSLSSCWLEGSLFVQQEALLCDTPTDMHVGPLRMHADAKCRHHL
jgi:hypothetical protein